MATPSERKARHLCIAPPQNANPADDKKRDRRTQVTALGSSAATGLLALDFPPCTIGPNLYMAVTVKRAHLKWSR